MRRRLGGLVLTVLVALQGTARADAAEPGPSAKRRLPSYDGRAPDSGPSPLHWVARVVLFPPYLVSEYVLRRPIGWAVLGAERHDLVEPKSPGGEGSFVPTFLVDAGQRSQLGLVYERRDFPARDDALRLHAAFGGLDWQRLIASERFALDASSGVTLRLEGWRRSDGVFYGIGPRAPAADQSFYGTEVARGSFTFQGGVGALGIEAHGRVERAAFHDDPCCGPTLAQTGVPHPAGFDEGVGVFAEGLSLSLDSRRKKADETGARLEIGAEHGIGFVGLSPDRWLGYRGTASGALDLTGHHRVLALAVHVRLVDPLGQSEVPFTELVSLGGDAPMRGFRGGRVRDRSAAVATVEYEYPIWAFLDGVAEVAIGNGFGVHLEELAPELMRLSFGGGIRSTGSGAVGFALLLATGTETFAAGTALEGVRFILGITPRF